MSVELFAVFFIAALALAFSPGPGMLYVLSRAIEGGTAAGVASTLGTALGGLIHVVAAAMGLSALLAVFPLSFVLIKYVGAVFLAYLGVRMLISANRTGRGVDGTDEKPRVVKVRAAFRQGIITEILNPKVALFFLTFIPQFISRNSENVIPQFLLLGTLVVFLNTIPDFIISFYAARIANRWNSGRRYRVGQRLVSGLILVLLACFLAMPTYHG